MTLVAYSFSFFVGIEPSFTKPGGSIPSKREEKEVIHITVRVRLPALLQNGERNRQKRKCWGLPQLLTKDRLAVLIRESKPSTFALPSDAHYQMPTTPSDLQWPTMSPGTHIACTKQSQTLLREWIGRVHKCLVWPDAEQAAPRGRFSDINNSKLTALLNWRPRDEFLLMNTSGTRLPKRCNFFIKPALTQVSLCVVRSQLEGIFSTLRKSFTKLPP